MSKRPLSIAEASSAFRHDLNIYMTVNLGLTISNTEQNEITTEEIYAAVKPIVELHPALATLLKFDQNDEAYYKLLADKIDLSLNVEFKNFESEEELQKAVLKMTSTKLDDLDRIPGWRLWITKVHNGIKLNFFFHHSLFDGTAAQDFLVQLVSNLQESKKDSDPVVATPNDAELVPSLEQLLGLELPLKGVVKGFTPPEDSGVAFWSGTPVGETSETSPYLTKCVRKVVSSDDLKKLLVKTKEHGTSLTPLITSVVLYSLQRFFSGKYVKATATIPRNTRPWVNPDEKYGKVPYGDFVSSIPVESSARTIPALWESARTMSSVIKGYNDRGTKDAYDEFISMAGDQKELYKRRIGEARTFSVEVSSVFITNGLPEKDSKWQVSDFTFIQGISSEGPPILCSTISYKDGPMVLSFSWASETVEDDTIVESTADEFSKTINQLLVLD